MNLYEKIKSFSFDEMVKFVLEQHCSECDGNCSGAYKKTNCRQFIEDILKEEVKDDGKAQIYSI